jgi:DNA-binding NtrC family response regulator
MQAISLHHKKGKARCSVKSALVVGGPGSGKDSMARLIQLFSPGYRFGRLRVFNMAMFRPKEAAVPLLFGLEANRKEPAQNSPWLSIRGALERAISEPDKPDKEEDKDSSEAERLKGERGTTLIFDELNSLDVDTQGALLRLLENAELRPLGGTDSSLERMDLLIIGVMNEDPHLIMKRQTIDRVLREPRLFGGILGESLYEFFRNQRRLRDDLYYRLIRGGEIVLPELKDRREDIPILFFFYLKTECEPLNPCADKHWNIELSVYEALMDERLSWEGNLRELQTVTRNIVLSALEHHKNPANESGVNIRGYHAQKVLGKMREKP